MARKMNNRRPSMGSGEIMMWLAGAMFCMVLITTAMMGGMFARYTTSAMGYDGARVATFGDITITENDAFVGTGITAKIAPGVDIVKRAVVDFEGSEAATYVFVEVEHSANWTGSGGVFSSNGLLTWQIADGWKQLDDHVFYIALIPGETLRADIIKDGKITVSGDITNTQIGDLAGTISFRASVIQSHGFESVNAAWTALQSKEVS